MRLLLDTHVLLWAMADHPSLSDDLRDALPGAELYLSAVSVWEIGIKQALGKLDVPTDIFDVAEGAGVLPLPITWAHAQAAAALPRHHADPFDRMLVAQARLEGLTLASADRAVAAYEVDVLS